MQPVGRPSNLPEQESSIGIFVALMLIIVLIIAGAAYGIVQVQRGLDQMYLPSKASASLTSSDGEARNLPPIMVVGNPAHGKDLFNMSCYVCHGPTGSGVPTLGANLRQSKFVRTRTDKQLITFIKSGRQPGDPNTVFNGTMPPKGGNPMLDDIGIQDVIAYIRTLQAADAGITVGDPSASSASTARYTSNVE